MPNQIKVENFYRSNITSASPIPVSGDFNFNVVVPPLRKNGYMILGSENITTRQIFYYHDVIGNTVYVRGINRVNSVYIMNPKGYSIKMNDVAEIFNYYGDNISTCFYLEKMGGLSVKVWGGYVLYNNVQQAVADTTLTLVDGTTNYIKYAVASNTISVDTSPTGNIKCEVVCSGGVVASVLYRVSKESYLDPLSSPNYVSKTVTEDVYGDKSFKGSTNLGSYNSGNTRAGGSSYDLGGSGGTEKSFQAGVWNVDGSFTPYLTVQRNGNIGIGLDNPGYKFHVNSFPGNQGVSGAIGRAIFIDEGTGLPGGISSESAGYGLGVYSPSGDLQFFAGGKSISERRMIIRTSGIIEFADHTVQPFYGPQHMLAQDSGFSFKWKSAANAMLFEVAPTAIGINKQLFRNYDSGGSANTLKIASRYELSGITHGNQGHILQFIWGDLNGNPEGTGIDGGWGLEFGPHGRPYLKMMGQETQVQNLRVMKTIAASNQNLNSFSDAGGGFFSGENMTNAPTADWYIVEVIVHSVESASAAYLVQRATCITGAGTGTVFSRVKSNTSWTSWTQLN